MYGGQEMSAAQNDIFNQKTFPENVKNISIILGVNSIILKVAFTAASFVHCSYIFLVLLTRKYQLYTQNCNQSMWLVAVSDVTISDC